MKSLLIKLSGEALGGEAGFGIDAQVLQRLCGELKQVVDAGVSVAIVLGGGNIFRGQALAQRGLDRVVGDRMGMLATVMNGLAMCDFLTHAGLSNQLFSAIAMPGLVKGYERDEALYAMRRGDVVVLSGGTGNPYFTTDTAACLRAIELGVDAIVKATNIDGVYSDDPRSNPKATKYATITYEEVLAKELGVMDLTAIVLCKEQKMPLIVLDLNAPGALVQVSQGVKVGTQIVAAS